jgi:hypothetical protein
MSEQLDLFEQDEKEKAMEKEFALEEAPHLVVLEPREHYDIAIIGVLDGSEKCVYDAERVVQITSEKCVYDAERVVQITAEIHGLDYEEAMEWFDYNIAGSKGENYPEYVWIDSYFGSEQAQQDKELDDLADAL